MKRASILPLRAQARPWTWVTSAALLPVALFASSEPAMAFGRKSDICTAANNYCNGPPARSSAPSYRAPSYSRPSAPSNSSRSVPRGPSPAEIERRRKAAEATRLNKLGISAWNQKDWGAAVRYFEAALLNSPDSKVIQENLARAKSELRWEQEKKKQARESEEAKARIERMLGGLADQFARAGTDAGAISLFDSGTGPAGFPTPSGRVGMINIDEAPDTVPKTSAAQPTQAPILEIEKPPRYTKGSPGSAPVVLGDGPLPTVNPGDLKGFGERKGIKFKEVPPPKISKPLFDSEGWRLDAKGQRIPGSRQIWSEKYQAYVDEFGRIHRTWPGPTKNPEGRLPNPLAEEANPLADEKALAADSKVISEELLKAILNHDRTRVWPGPTRPKQESAASR